MHLLAGRAGPTPSNWLTSLRVQRSICIWTQQSWEIPIKRVLRLPLRNTDMLNLIVPQAWHHIRSTGSIITWESKKSACGMIWKYVRNNNQLPQMNDVRPMVRQLRPLWWPWLLSTFCLHKKAVSALRLKQSQHWKARVLRALWEGLPWQAECTTQQGKLFCSLKMMKGVVGKGRKKMETGTVWI